MGELTAFVINSLTSNNLELQHVLKSRKTTFHKHFWRISVCSVCELLVDLLVFTVLGCTEWLQKKRDWYFWFLNCSTCLYVCSALCMCKKLWMCIHVLLDLYVCVRECVCGRGAEIKEAPGWICRADVAAKLKGLRLEPIWHCRKCRLWQKEKRLLGHQVELITEFFKMI